MTLLILYALLALGVSFICSLLEASLLSLPRSQVELMVQQGSAVGRRMQRLKDNIDRPLAAILTLNTIAHTVGAAGVGAQAALLFDDGAVGIASAIMTLLILVLSEIIPKTIGAVYARSLVSATVWVTQGMIWLCYPIILVLEWINRLIAFQPHHSRISRMEILATIRLGKMGGSLGEREHRIITNLMSLHAVRVSEIVTPRTVVFALPQAQTVRETLAAHPSLRFARVPIYAETVDDCARYVVRYELHRALAEERGDQQLAALARQLLVLPEQASVADALNQLLETGEHIALIVDEHGGVEGLITLEDVLETLLGHEIVDETDPAPDMQALARFRARRWQSDVRHASTTEGPVASDGDGTH